MFKWASPICILFFCIITQAFASIPRYMMIVDAGSTGSRLHIIEYVPTSTMPILKDIYSVSVKPGLASYKNHPEQAGEGLKKLFDQAALILKEKKADIASTPIHILATAGMRSLPEDTQATIYAALRDYLQSHYAFHIGELKTISGKMEGVYGWLDINYLLGHFEQHTPTVGSIDMGGASTQIAFATQDLSKPEDEVTLRINQQPYTIFSKSFLGLGQDQLRQKINTEASAASCYPQNYTFDEKTRGYFEFTTCKNLYAQLLEAHKLTQQLIPIPNIPFVAYAGIYFSYHFFEVDQTPHAPLFASNIQRICHFSWEELKQRYPDISPAYLSNYCADGTYHYQLLYDLYQLTDTQLIVSNQIQETEINWTLGAALFYTV